MKKILCGSISVSYDLWLPYSSGCLIDHAMRFCDVSEVSFPEPLYKWLPDDELRIRLAGIDVLCLTCYVWNHEYNLHMSRIFKEVSPHGLVVFGGPEIPLNVDAHDGFAADRPWVDCFVSGPGEQTFAAIVGSIECDPSTWPNCFGRGWSNVTSRPAQIKSSQMPRPYTNGIFDSIVAKEKRIKASFETNRGCPYKCAFCDWGGQANDAVVKFTLDFVFDEIDWIYEHANIKEIEILDANFGMHRRDLETVLHMRKAKDRSGNNPTVSYSGLVKNGSPYLADIIKIIHGDLGAERRHLKLSFQTHSKTTLDTVLRDNIDNSRLLRLLTELGENDIDVSSEMIIGLPGETADSWLASQETDYKHGIGFMRTYILNLVCNTKLYEPEYRSRYRIRSKKILIPYEVKSYSKDRLITDPSLSVKHGSSFESSEIVHSCHSFDTDEIVLMFRYFWYYHNFFNSMALRGMMKYLDSKGVGVFEQARIFAREHEKHAFLREVLGKHDAVVRRIYGDEDHTILTDYASYRFFSGSLRTDDLYQMLMNRDSLRIALCDIFDGMGDIDDIIKDDMSGWLPVTTPLKTMADRLLSMGGNVRMDHV